MIISRWLVVAALGFALLSVSPPRVFGVPSTARPMQVDQATITVLQNMVWLTEGESGSSHPVVTGEVVQAGDRLATDVTGRALITFFDGSEVELQPGTEVLLQRIGQTAGGGTLTQIAQAGGLTVNRIASLGEDSSYQVQTPNSTALVRGTAFSVEVERDPNTGLLVEVGYAVTEGAVDVRVGGDTRTVLPGEFLEIRPIGQGGLETVGGQSEVVQGVVTPEPTAVEFSPDDLSGLWEYDDLEIEIEQDGDDVVARYVDEFECEYEDDNSDNFTVEIETVFDAELEDQDLFGTWIHCYEEPFDPPGPTHRDGGPNEFPMHLEVSDDGMELEGHWLDTHYDEHELDFDRVIEAP